MRYLLPDGVRGAVEPPPVPPDEIVDTLGAGDVLHGAYCAELARGAGQVEALGRAVATATVSIRHRGARSWSLLEPPAAPRADV